MSTPTATAAPTAPAPAPQAAAFNALGQTIGGDGARPLQAESPAFDMGLDAESVLATFFNDEPSKAPPASDKGAKAETSVAPAPASGTAGTGAAAEPAAAAPSSGTATPPISSPPQAPAPAGSPAVPGVSSPSAAAPTAAELEKDLRIQGMEAELARLRAVAAPAPAPAAVQVTEPELAAPAYNLDVPDQLVSAILSEDPRTSKAGVVALVNSLATIVHANMQKEMKGYVPTLLQRFETRQTEATQVAELNRDYYGAFPTHNSPAIAQMVAQEATLLQQQTGVNSWSPQMRDAVGARVNARIAAMQAAGIPIVGVSSPAAPVPATPAVPVATAPAPFAPVSTREGVSASGDAMDFMRRTIQG